VSPSVHTVQFFDASSSLAEALSTFVGEGLASAEAVVLLLTPAHADATLRRCREKGIDVAGALASQQLLIRDAEDALAGFMRRDLPDPLLFEATIASLLHTTRAWGGRVRVFGEAVDVLVRQNQFAAAERLEQLWNAVMARERFTLFCGYSSEHFGNPRDAASLRRICELHSHRHAEPHDVLGSFLLKTRAAC
jgi:hypothetical protein